MAREGLTYGLLGRTLGHSWSPQIHATLGSVPYELVEVEPDEVAPLIREGAWRGLNVTIPYKREAAAAADVLSSRVQALGVANTLVRLDDGRVLAENTDVLGFNAMLAAFARERLGASAHEALCGREALVLGTGGAARAVAHALKNYAECQVTFVSRTGPCTYADLPGAHADAAIVVNATPVGMYPDCPASPLADGVLEAMPGLLGVLDVVYNPLRTGLMLQAEAAGIPCEGGLGMLAWQALFASELFQGRDLDDALVAKVIGDLRSQMANIALIGMPGAGKTSCGRALARILHRPFIDMDDAFEVEEGMGAGDFIRAHGEAAFRERETAVLRSYASRTGLVIACGGGVVTRPENLPLLRQNGTVVFLDRPLEQLSSKGRPLSQAKGVERLAQERMGLYHAWADLAIRCTGSAAGDAEEIRRLLGL